MRERARARACAGERESARKICPIVCVHRRSCCIRCGFLKMSLGACVLCICVCERERKRDSVCVCVRARAQEEERLRETDRAYSMCAQAQLLHEILLLENVPRLVCVVHRCERGRESTRAQRQRESERERQSL